MPEFERLLCAIYKMIFKNKLPKLACIYYFEKYSFNIVINVVLPRFVFK